MPLVILAADGGRASAWRTASKAIRHFILALVALTAVVGVGLNVLLGLTGQVSLGHVGFYAIGAYAAAILTTNGMNFWLAFPLAGADRRRRSARCWRCRRCASAGPYLAMVTIAFAFIVQHGADRVARTDRRRRTA